MAQKCGGALGQDVGIGSEGHEQPAEENDSGEATAVVAVEVTEETAGPVVKKKSENERRGSWPWDKLRAEGEAGGFIMEMRCDACDAIE